MQQDLQIVAEEVDEDMNSCPSLVDASLFKMEPDKQHVQVDAALPDVVQLPRRFSALLSAETRRAPGLRALLRAWIRRPALGYELQVFDGHAQWRIKRTYDEFVALRQSLPPNAPVLGKPKALRIRAAVSETFRQQCFESCEELLRGALRGDRCCESRALRAFLDADGFQEAGGLPHASASRPGASRLCKQASMLPSCHVHERDFASTVSTAFPEPSGDAVESASDTAC